MDRGEARVPGISPDALLRALLGRIITDMSRSRRMPPLFEVMRETNPARSPMIPVPVTPPPAAGPKPAANPTPVVRSIPSPPTSPPPREPAPAARVSAPLSLRPSDPSPEEDDAPPAAAAPTAGGVLDLNRPVVVPFKTILIAASVGFALLVLVWVVGWRSGGAAARQDWVGGIEADPAQVTPNVPLPSQDPLNGASTPVQRPTQATRPAPTTTRPPEPRTAPAQAATPAPGAITDPRGTELNYLLVEAVTHYADAEAIVAFLDANGLPAVAIPKGSADIAAAKAAGQRNWEVVLLEGIPGNQYRAKEARRNELVRQVQQLGERLGREGLSNYRLAGPFWKKY
jgi:hypothetical protein